MRRGTCFASRPSGCPILSALSEGWGLSLSPNSSPNTNRHARASEFHSLHENSAQNIRLLRTERDRTRIPNETIAQRDVSYKKRHSYLSATIGSTRVARRAGT